MSTDIAEMLRETEKIALQEMAKLARPESEIFSKRDDGIPVIPDLIMQVYIWGEERVLPALSQNIALYTGTKFISPNTVALFIQGQFYIQHDLLELSNTILGKTSCARSESELREWVEKRCKSIDGRLSMCNKFASSDDACVIPLTDAIHADRMKRANMLEQERIEKSARSRGEAFPSMEGVDDIIAALRKKGSL